MAEEKEGFVSRIVRGLGFGSKPKVKAVASGSKKKAVNAMKKKKPASPEAPLGSGGAERTRQHLKDRKKTLDEQIASQGG